MSTPFLLVLLPYVISILIKLSGLFIDEGGMSQSLQTLVSVSRAPGSGFDLTGDQQRVIIKHLSHASLRSTAVLTAITSSFAAFLVVLTFPQVPWVSWFLLPFSMVLCVAFVWWVYPKPVGYFAQRGWLGAEQGTLVILASCLYDVVLGVVSLFAVRFATVPQS